MTTPSAAPGTELSLLIKLPARSRSTEAAVLDSLLDSGAVDETAGKAYVQQVGSHMYRARFDLPGCTNTEEALRLICDELRSDFGRKASAEELDIEWGPRNFVILDVEVLRIDEEAESPLHPLEAARRVENACVMSGATLGHGEVDVEVISTRGRFYLIRASCGLPLHVDCTKAVDAIRRELEQTSLSVSFVRRMRTDDLRPRIS